MTEPDVPGEHRELCDWCARVLPIEQAHYQLVRDPHTGAHTLLLTACSQQHLDRVRARYD